MSYESEILELHKERYSLIEQLQQLGADDVENQGKELDNKVDVLSEKIMDIIKQFIDELEAAIYHLQAFPETGSPRFAHLLDLPELRSWSLKRFPFLIFYFETAVSIDIWRILHQHRDVPAHLHQDE